MVNIKAKMMFVLVGDDMTGKTTLQKMLIERLTDRGWYDSLKTNLLFDIVHPEIKQKFQTISFANRSYQEKKADYYLSVENYFVSYFKVADIAFLASHLVVSDLDEMIQRGKMLFYNVYGVFWTNSIDANATNYQISALNWDERFVIDNPVQKEEGDINAQLGDIADGFVELIINRTKIS